MSRQHILTIDPISMGITNRISAGCQLQCQGEYQGGLLVQGQVNGQLRIRGPLVVWEGGLACGQIEVFGDLYAFGQLGLESDAKQTMSNIICHGTLYVAHSALSYASVAAQRIYSYDGAQVYGPLRTIKSNQQLPELNL